MLGGTRHALPPPGGSATNLWWWGGGPPPCQGDTHLTSHRDEVGVLKDGGGEVHNTVNTVKELRVISCCVDAEDTFRLGSVHRSGATFIIIGYRRWCARCVPFLFPWNINSSVADISNSVSRRIYHAAGELFIYIALHVNVAVKAWPGVAWPGRQGRPPHPGNLQTR